MELSELATAQINDSDATDDERALYYTALYDYIRNGESELSFKEHEVLAILDNSGDWWYAQNGHEEAGWVPPSYLDVDNPIPYVVVYNQFLEDSVHEDDLPNLPDPIDEGPAPFLGSLTGSRANSRAPSTAQSESANGEKADSVIHGQVVAEVAPADGPAITIQTSFPSSLVEYIKFDAGPPAVDSDAEENDLKFSAKINDWCRSTSKVFDETIKSTKQNSANNSGASLNNSLEASVAPTAEQITETVEIVSYVFVNGVIGSMDTGTPSRQPKDVVQIIENTSNEIISGLGHEDEAIYENEEFENFERFSKDVLDQARISVSRIMESAVVQNALHIKYLDTAIVYVKNALSGAVARVAEQIMNQQYRAVHARHLTRTISKSLTPASLTLTRTRSKSITSHDPSGLAGVSQLRDAKKRILSMEQIDFASAPPTPKRHSDDYPFGEGCTGEESLVRPVTAPMQSRRQQRPKSSSAHLPSRSTIEFDKVLRSSNCSSRAFIKQFQIQRAQRARKNAKAVFEALHKAIPAGESAVLSVHDYMATLVRPMCKGSKGAREYKEGWGIQKGDEINLSKKGTKKKSGMVIYVDPSIDTTGLQCFLHIAYGPQFGTAQKITIANDGSYCGLELTGAKWNLEKGVTPVPPLSTHSDFDLNRLAASFELEVPDRSIPGWCGTLPIFIPSDRCKCRLEIRKINTGLDLSHTLLRNPRVGMPPLTRPKTAPLIPTRGQGVENRFGSAMDSLSLFTFSAISLNAAMTIVNDYLGSKLRKDVANDDSGGGASSLHVAALHGNVEAVRHLVDVAGASINACCKISRQTPLHEAVNGGNTEVVAFLISRGSNALIKDNSDRLPIHLACEANHVSIVRLLLNAKGAKKSLLSKDGKGKTPRQLCASKFLRTILEDTMRKMYILKTCTLLEKGNRGQELFETLAKPNLTRPGTAPVYRPGGPSIL